MVDLVAEGDSDCSVRPTRRIEFIHARLVEAGGDAVDLANRARSLANRLLGDDELEVVDMATTSGGEVGLVDWDVAFLGVQLERLEVALSRLETL